MVESASSSRMSSGPGGFHTILRGSHKEEQKATRRENTKLNKNKLHIIVFAQKLLCLLSLLQVLPGAHAYGSWIAGMPYRWSQLFGGGGSDSSSSPGNTDVGTLEDRTCPCCLQPPAVCCYMCLGIAFSFWWFVGGGKEKLSGESEPSLAELTAARKQMMREKAASGCPTITIVCIVVLLGVGYYLLRNTFDGSGDINDISKLWKKHKKKRRDDDDEADDFARQPAPQRKGGGRAKSKAKAKAKDKGKGKGGESTDKGVVEVLVDTTEKKNALPSSVGSAEPHPESPLHAPSAPPTSD